MSISFTRHFVPFGETFHNRDHARALIKLYRRSYNERRPHSSLGYLTPREFAATWRRENEQKQDGCAGGTGIRLKPGMGNWQWAACTKYRI
jgi:hypothetical protein